MRNILIAIAILGTIGCSQSTDKKGFDDKPLDTTPVRAEVKVDDSDTIVLVGSGATMSEMKFDKKTIAVPADKEITIALVNESTDASMPHNVVIINEGTANDVGQAGLKFKDNGYVNPEDSNVIAHSEVAQMGETVYLTFTTPSAGDYEFICSYPGHWGLMKGKFLTR